MKKKIVLINRLSLGGAEEFFIELSKVLNYDFGVLENDISYKFHSKIIEFGIKKNHTRILKILIKIFILLKIKLNYEEVICFDNETGLLSSLINNKKTKIIIHSYLPVFYQRRNKIITQIIKIILVRSDLIAVSQSSKLGIEKFLERKLPNTKIIYNIINKDKIMKLKKNNKVSFFIISRLDQDKNILLAIKMIYNLKKKFNNKNISLKIFGDGNLKNKINEIIRKYDLSDNILVFGFKINPYYLINRDDILLNFSIYEGWSRTLMESLLNRLRYISFDSPYGPREILTNSLKKINKYPLKLYNGYLVNVIHENNKSINTMTIAERKLLLLMNKILNEKINNENYYHPRKNQTIKELKEII